VEHEIDCLAGAGDGGLDRKEETQETPTKREELQTFCQDSVSYNKIDDFVAGQPLGDYSSWPLFALSHHLLVWICAEEVYPGSRFIDYPG